jgi:hypothetical protein
MGSCIPQKSSQIKTDPVKPPPVVSQDDKKTQEYLLSPIQFPSYEIIHQVSHLRSGGGDTLFVLVPPLESEFENIGEKAKNLVKKLVVLEKRPENISILIFDDAQALEKVFQNAQTEDLNVPVHYIAKYTASPEVGVYRCNLYLFPIAPDSNPVVKSMSDIIEFDPYNW